MENIRRRNGKIIATYKGIDYTFKNIIDLLIAIATLNNVIKTVAN